MEFNNLEDFIYGSHPKINGHHDNSRYLDYWSPIMQDVIEGKWGHDYNHKTSKGGWRFMPNNLVWYANFFLIERGKNQFGLPTLRGIDWFIGYAMAEMEGFSGFKGDKVFTCSKIAKLLHAGLELTSVQQDIHDANKEWLYTDDGKLKQYIAPQPYLWRTHKDPMGDPMYFDEALNMLLLSSRRLGKTYHALSKFMRSYVTDGSMSFENLLEGTSRFVGVMCDHAGAYTEGNVDKYFLAYNNLMNYGSYQVDEYVNVKGDLDGQGFFWEPIGGSPKMLDSYFTNAVKEQGGSGIVGAGSRIGRYSVARNASKAVGQAPFFYHFEEVGTWNNFRVAHSECDKATVRDAKFGSIFSTGTGGNFEFIGSVRPSFYNPSNIKGVEFPNAINPGGKNTSCFIPTQYHKLTYYDELGNHKQDFAYQDCLKQREDWLETMDESAYRQECASHPMIHNDIFIDSSHTYFPKARASENLTKLETSPKIYVPGTLEWPNKNHRHISFVEDHTTPPLMNHEDIKEAYKTNRFQGCFIRLEAPDPNGIYRTMYDPTAHDHGSSLACSMTYNFKTNKFAGIWIGRHGDFEKDDEMAIKMALYFGGTLFPELNNPHIRTLITMYNLYDIMEPPPIEAMQSLIPNWNPKYEDYGLVKVSNSKIPMWRLTGRMMVSKVGTRKNDKSQYVDELWIDQCNAEILLNDTVYHSTEDSANFDAMASMDLLSLLMKQYEIEGMGTNKELEYANDSVSKVTQALVSAGGYRTNIKQLTGF